MKPFRTSFSIAMAVLVLMASSSFYLSTHVCGGEVKAVAFLAEADGCGHADLPPCHRALTKGCCENHLIAHDGQDIKKESVLETLPLLPTLQYTITPVILATVVPASPALPHFNFHYDTPLSDTDRSVVLCTFLI